eukprot:CAMPEP_0178379984 /NCGR_PEP_ID=MMETSP0689_2-20121128/5226_1 /TAXON_ID=160604 /ORGANISM="Amphidinium massartii, Strain CS-259" /LENGTH=173 /DNA_ID=CAMNT_0020000107 /DNA_START=382 /DNA_END=904 /DNA_ORIENTATION=+
MEPRAADAINALNSHLDSVADICRCGACCLDITNKSLQAIKCSLNDLTIDARIILQKNGSDGIIADLNAPPTSAPGLTSSSAMMSKSGKLGIWTFQSAAKSVSACVGGMIQAITSGLDSWPAASTEEAATMQLRSASVTFNAAMLRSSCVSAPTGRDTPAADSLLQQAPQSLV